MYCRCQTIDHCNPIRHVTLLRYGPHLQRRPCQQQPPLALEAVEVTGEFALTLLEALQGDNGEERKGVGRSRQVWLHERRQGYEAEAAEYQEAQRHQVM